jgi:hypothetical protein
VHAWVLRRGSLDDRPGAVGTAVVDEVQRTVTEAPWVAASELSSWVSRAMVSGRTSCSLKHGTTMLICMAASYWRAVGRVPTLKRRWGFSRVRYRWLTKNRFT